jgi:hypothetical protein
MPIAAIVVEYNSLLDYFCKYSVSEWWQVVVRIWFMRFHAIWADDLTFFSYVPWSRVGIYIYIYYNNNNHYNNNNKNNNNNNIYYILVGGLDFFHVSIYWEFHHPN